MLTLRSSLAAYSAGRHQTRRASVRQATGEGSIHRLVSGGFGGERKNEDELEVIRGGFGTHAEMCVRVSYETRYLSRSYACLVQALGLG